jgi:hypothetical protein
LNEHRMYWMAANASRGSEAGLPAHVFQLFCLPRDITTSDAVDSSVLAAPTIEKLSAQHREGRWVPF